MMDAYDDITVTDLVFMTSAQIGKSEILLNLVGHIISNQPGPILSLNPTLDMAETFSKDRIAPMFRDTPILKRLTSDVASRDYGNTLLYKQFPGGQLTLAGANSPASLASRPIRVTLADEIDRYPVSAGTEGDPIELAEKRTVNFWNRKRVRVSTPTVKGASRIEVAYQQSDRRRFFVPCPHCTEMQTLEWGQVKWDEGAAGRAWYVCVHCACVITEGEKREAVSKGEWRGSAPFTGIAGFHINELYSPWRTLGDVAKAFLLAQGNPQRLKVWVNTSLGEVWEDSGESVEPNALMARAEEYRLTTAPSEALVITAGADVQGDRIEACIWGFGPGEESWVLDHQVFDGNPSEGVVWAQFLEWLEQPLQHERGKQTVARTVAIDSSGHHTQQVYSFCRANRFRRLKHGMQQIIPIIGRSGARAVISKPTLQDIDLNGEKIPKGIQLYTVGVDLVKDTIYGRLRLELPGHGYIHFSTGLPEEFYDQLTAEKRMTKYTRGFPRQEWTLKSGKRNEALDCSVYAYAAASLLGLQRFKGPFWEAQRLRMTVLPHERPTPVEIAAEAAMPAVDPEETPAAPVAAAPPPARIEAPPSPNKLNRGRMPPRQSNWVKSW
jgi:phage terminase large subunit GpA-like protein